MDHQSFSRAGKIALSQYLNGESHALDALEGFLKNVQTFDLSYLENDKDKKAFWINVYNGLTNYQIVKNQLSESVWEKEDFFRDELLVIGDLSFSLDDIEHGILRKNGPRKNNKPRQFSDGDLRLKLMIEKMDYRVHFALNCGSVSCPPIAFYSSEKIDQQLSDAEASFSASEFIVNHAKKTVECSSIFLWYRTDFRNHYLNDSVLSQYTVIERSYIWKIQ
ncbi:DUF547 domain-containing protein [Roseivirga sp. E12]|uniref:DUF547 domain-containing protein n=1 Tax=Roseivirga sp. E12 TaxID=2819237 RepID=UPI001ABD2169|nr:DUF547 domain-containing protein [Roseivirga sp. E12]MBO3700585.1 DUF547 domain-containing protein [Roseivirga sp. E12]